MSEHAHVLEGVKVSRFWSFCGCLVASLKRDVDLNSSGPVHLGQFWSMIHQESDMVLVNMSARFRLLLSQAILALVFWTHAQAGSPVPCLLEKRAKAHKASKVTVT